MVGSTDLERFISILYLSISLKIVYFCLRYERDFQVHIEYTAAALFEEFYAVDGVNKAVSPDPFYRFIDDVVFTPFDFDAERAKISDETESNYYLSRCLKLTRQRHRSNTWLSEIHRIRSSESEIPAIFLQNKTVYFLQNAFGGIF